MTPGAFWFYETTSLKYCLLDINILLIDKQYIFIDYYNIFIVNKLIWAKIKSIPLYKEML